jgi:hypothetical protein
MRRRSLVLLPLALVLLLVVAAPAFAALAPPWDGNPISPLISPTSFGLSDWAGGSYAGEAVASKQTAPLALIPNSAIGPTLGLIQAEATTAGMPHRMDYSVSGKSAGGRDMYVVVINDLETANQRRDYLHWQNIRNLELTDPAGAQALLASYGDNVKMPIYIEANINGTEYEGTDAMLQAIRDLTTTPRGANATVDKILDHCILVVVPTANPDGRVAGIRGNAAVADTNRDYFLQSQPEEKIDAALQQQYLAPGALHMHGYVTPTLIDGLTMPHNPGLQYDIFAKWNQERTAQNKADFAAMGYQIQRPVNDWNANGSLPATGHLSEVAIGGTTGDVSESADTVTVHTAAAHNLAAGDDITIAGVSVAGYNGTFKVLAVIDDTHFTYTDATIGLATSRRGGVWSPKYPDVLGPQVSQAWDDWGPFYGQTYMAFLGVDSSTVEMASTTRLVSKTAQYMAFYSSANFWLDRRQAMMHDQLVIFERGVTNAATDPNAISKVPELVSAGFSDALHNWMATYPKAYVIPFGEGQRSNAEANRLAQWCLDNGIQVQRVATDFTWSGHHFQAGSYVVSMSQALRGLAWNALSAGTDIENRITTLYASPAAWSHGLLWGADVVEIPRDDAAFAPQAAAVSATNDLSGGVRDGVDAPASWYAVALRGVTEDKAALSLLRQGVLAELAEAPFTTSTGVAMPAGSLIFPADAATAATLDAAGKTVGMWFERNVGAAKPATSVVSAAPKVAILATSVPTTGADTDGVLKRIFGADAQYVATVSGTNSLENAAVSPLIGYDVICNAGAAFPTSVAVAAAPGGATEAGNTVTITTTASHNLAVGARITVAGVADTGFNGTFTVASVVSTTQFTYTAATAGLAASGGGTVTYTGAQERLNAFFARGGGYIATNSSSTNFSFLTGAVPALVTGSLTQGSQSGFGGIAVWSNAGATSPITGAYPATDTMFLPSNTTYFSATPAGAIVDAQYPASITTLGPANGYVSGMWLARDAAANNAPVLIHGATTAGSRYVAYATNPFSRYDAERDWPIVVQAALWSDMIDKTSIDTVAYTITASAGPHGMISPSGAKSVAVGATQSYAIAPDTGWSIAAVMVDGKSVGAVTPVTMQNVQDDHTIAASFADTTKPAVSDDATTGWKHAAVTVHLTATDAGSGVASVQYSIDGAAFQIGTTVTIATGVHTVVYHATDVAGNVSADKTFTVQIDTTLPTVTSDADAAWHSDAVTVHLSPADAGGSGLAGTEYRATGSSGWTAASGNVFIVAAPTNGGNDGAHSYEFRATDGAGNTSITGSCTVKIDTQKPATTATGLAAGAGTAWRNTAQTVSLSAQDATSGVGAIHYTVDGAAAQTYTGSFSVAGAGSHSVTYWSVDAAGNTEAVHTGFVNIDTGAPTATALNNVTARAGKSATLKMRLADAAPSCGSAVVTVTIVRNGKTAKTLTFKGVTLGQFSRTFTAPLRKGVYTWTARATDAVGNTQIKASARMTLTVK